MKTFKQRFLVILLVLALTLTITGTQSSFASSTQLPDGKNYLDPAFIENNGSSWEYGEAIFVKANTNYTLTFPSSYAYDIFEGDNTYLMSLIDGNVSTIFDEGVDASYPHEDVFEVAGSHQLSITFNTGSNTQITGLSFASTLDYITYSLLYTMINSIDRRI